MTKTYQHSVYTITRKEPKPNSRCKYNTKETGWTQQKTGMGRKAARDLATEMANDGHTIVAMYRQPRDPTPEECEQISRWKPYAIWFGGNEYRPKK